MTSREQVLHIKFSRFFEKQLGEAPRAIRDAFIEVLQLIRTDRHHVSLRNHALKDRYAGFRSIDVTPDWRAVFKETITDNETTLTFRLLGTHKQLYG